MASLSAKEKGTAALRRAAPCNLFCCCQHKLDAVLLIDAGGAGIVVKREDICFLGNFFNLVNHAAAGDVIWQAAEGLGADDIGVAAARKLQHFGSEQPALAHVVAVADNAIGHGLRFFVGRRCAEGSGA